MNSLPTPIHDLLTGLWNSPAVFFIVVGLNILGVMLQQFPVWPNRWNAAIPWLLVAVGIAFTVALVPSDIFPAHTQSPKLLLGIIGFVLGFVAFTLHKSVVQWATNFISSKIGINKTETDHTTPP